MNGMLLWGGWVDMGFIYIVHVYACMLQSPHVAIFFIWNFLIKSDKIKVFLLFCWFGLFDTYFN